MVSAKKDVKKSISNVGGNLTDKFNTAPEKFSVATLKSIASGFVDDVNALKDAYKAMQRIKDGFKLK